MSTVPDWITYDEASDVLTVHGKRYAGRLFGPQGFLAEPGTVLEIVKGRDDVVTVKSIGEAYWIEQHGVQVARAGVQEVSAGFDDIAFDGQPEAWSEKPFARIRWFEDDGDPSVGLPGRCGWTLARDQSGTVIGELAAKAWDAMVAPPGLEPGSAP